MQQAKYIERPPTASGGRLRSLRRCDLHDDDNRDHCGERESGGAEPKRFAEGPAAHVALVDNTDQALGDENRHDPEVHEKPGGEDGDLVKRMRHAAASLARTNHETTGMTVTKPRPTRNIRSPPAEARRT